MKAFVITRDRVTYTRQCVDALLTAGLDVHVVDHDSTYEPMRAWLAIAHEGRGPAGNRVHVHWRPNAHPRELWTDGTLAAVVGPDERFIVTDCDVIPDETCPADWPAQLAATLDAQRALRKAGLGLRTEDLPAHYAHRDRVRLWERQFWAPERRLPGPPAGYVVSLDTTLAMYQRLERFALDPSVRLAPPYLARHLAWYEDSANPTAEHLHYQANIAPGISHWLDPATYEKG